MPALGAEREGPGGNPSLIIKTQTHGILAEREGRQTPFQPCWLCGLRQVTCLSVPKLSSVKRQKNNCPSDLL